MLLLALLGLILLACYAYASTSPVLTMGDPEGYTEAQAWADDLDASLCPMQRAISLGIIPDPWTPKAPKARAPKGRPSRAKGRGRKPGVSRPQVSMSDGVG